MDRYTLNKMYAPAGNFRKQFKKLLGVDISPYHIHMVLQNLGIKPITTEYFGKPNISLYNINQIKYLLDNNKDKIIQVVRNIEKLSENKNSNNNNMRKIRLTESDIRRIVKNSVRKAIRESFDDDWNDMIDKRSSQGLLNGFEMKNSEGDWEYGDITYDPNTGKMSCMGAEIDVDPDMTIDQNLEALYDELMNAGYSDGDY